jgi:hypothetical protein
LPARAGSAGGATSCFLYLGGEGILTEVAGGAVDLRLDLIADGIEPLTAEAVRRPRSSEVLDEGVDIRGTRTPELLRDASQDRIVFRVAGFHVAFG